MVFIECFDQDLNPVIVNLSAATCIEAYADVNEENDRIRSGIMVHWGSQHHLPNASEDPKCDIFHGVTYDDVIGLLGCKSYL